MNDDHDEAAIGTEPGELVRLVAEGLAAHGFAARSPGGDDGCHLVIGGEGPRCAVWVGDEGDVEWECWPQARGQADPKQVADIATTLLTGRAQDYPRLGAGYGHETVTFKGVVGLEMKARGFAVDLEIFEDKDYFDASAGIAVTRPGSVGGGTIYVTDDGCLTWTRTDWTGAVAGEPGHAGWTAHSQQVAGAIVATVARALCFLAPPGLVTMMESATED